jgi:RHS repeat-associated protein
MTWDGRFSYTYDAENRLVAAYSNGLCVVSNAYDHLSRRVLKYTPTATYTCIYDGWNLVQETIQNQQSATTNHYVWGKDLSGTLQGAGGVGGLLAVSLNGTWYFPFYDNNGNITAYADETGTIVAEYTYDAFGRTIEATGLLADAFRHRFSTKYYDAETGFYYYGYRFYAPELMRWLSRDPIGENGGCNIYAFVDNNSFSFVDWLGLENLCHCFNWTVDVVYRCNWKNVLSAEYNYVRVSGGMQYPYSERHKGLFGVNHTDRIMWVSVAVTPKNWFDGIVKYDPEHCECGAGTVNDLPYTPLVRIKSQAGVTEEHAWQVVFNAGGGSAYDYWITQFVEQYESPFASNYTVEVSENGEVCSTLSFTIVY